MCPQFNMDETSHKQLKSYAAEHGASMNEVLRTALASFFAAPVPILPTADARTKTWYVVAHVWFNEGLERTVHATLASTAELPSLAERACREAGAPVEGVAAYARAELPTFRRNLARAPDAASLRLTHDLWMLQMSVHRTPPDGFDPEPIAPIRFRR